jgi:hypothetical protein
MSNAIELYSRMANPIEAINQIGEFFAKSGMFGCEKTEQGKVLAMVCLAEQKSPTEICRTYDIVDGKLRKKALAAYADFRLKGGKCKWIKTGFEPVKNEDEREAVGEFTFEGSVMTVAFSIAQARQAGANFKPGSNWSKTPGNMLRARVISNALGMLCPEIFAGSDEEMETDRREVSLDLGVTKPAPPVTVEVHAEVKPSTVTEADFAPVQKTAAPPPKAEPVATVATAHAPQPTAAATPATAAAPNNAELIEKVEAILLKAGGTAVEDALAWFQKHEWIPKGGTVADIRADRLQRILAGAEAFLRSIKGAAAAQGAK